MKVNAYAKINVGLDVVRRMENGYHELNMIMAPINIYDTIDISFSPTMEVTSNLRFIPTDERNSVVKVINRLRDIYHFEDQFKIHMEKHVPTQAGLGGGSSDAAAMMQLLNDYYHLDLTTVDMEQRLAAFGADCPFFIYNTPCYAEGIGDILTPIDLDLKGTRIVLIKPDEGVSTKEAYSGVTPRGEGLRKLDKLDDLDILGNLDKLTNDFEATVFPHHPIIADIKKHLLDAGAYYASMSGSGSTVFGLFKNDPEGRTDTNLALLKQQFASMVLLDDTFGEWKS